MHFYMLFLQLTNLHLEDRELPQSIKLAVDCRAVSAQDGTNNGQGGESPGPICERI